MKISELRQRINKYKKTIAIAIPICIVFLTYLYCMFIAPWFEGGGFVYVQKVWRSWQGLNVGALAFISSYTIYLAATYHENSRRVKAFRANRALLPQALSEITHYLERCVEFIEGVRKINSSKSENGNLTHPNLPELYPNIFKSSIETADAYFGEYLAGIIAKLQINNSRLKELAREANRANFSFTWIWDTDEQVCDLVEIHAMVSNIYSYSRGQTDYIKDWLTLDGMENSVKALGVEEHNFEKLAKAVKKRVKTGGMLGISVSEIKPPQQ